MMYATLPIVFATDFIRITSYNVCYTKLLRAAISGTEKVNMRSVHIETDNGSFTGTISLSVFDTGALNGIIKKLLAVKGIQSVARIGHNNGSTL